ncbi:Uma2 family endonuclease [Floridanema evergladense]|uniref:Uma2 family endonuclease n=1 Tax=Floridaenema evergladense BLCC-F167 TaxID=3153639 RepID=A0ABV4WPZ5_9CYAN
MTIASQKMSLAEYLNFDDGTDTWYELENGELVAMPPESDRNQRIASLLFAFFLNQGISSYRLRIGTEIVVSSLRATTRFPDLIVLSEELATALEGANRSTITLDMPPPLLVVEVVSPGQEKRDYRYKRSEYGARGIAEYWIVDPMQQKVTVLEWVEGLYEEKVFQGDSAIASPLFGILNLTTAQILQ